MSIRTRQSLVPLLLVLLFSLTGSLYAAPGGSTFVVDLSRSNQALSGPPPLSQAAAPDYGRGDLVAAVSASRTFADITHLATIQAPATTTRRTGTVGQQMATLIS